MAGRRLDQVDAMRPVKQAGVISTHSVLYFAPGVQLLYGERLRRARATKESRPHLAAGLEIFERLGARPWASRAASELRATGQTRACADQPPRDSLTPQERQIAMLAAAGLTNKEIGQRLFMSHRTVGAHLYQLFPKLGITTRAALRDALASQPPEPQRESQLTVTSKNRPCWAWRAGRPDGGEVVEAGRGGAQEYDAGGDAGGHGEGGA
jgi:DNA-binding CsgD family transcriptional regulator